MAESPSSTLARLGAEYFNVQHTSDPLNATLLGVTGFDDLLPDLTREGTDRTARRLGRLAEQVAALPEASLTAAESIDREVLGWLIDGARTDNEHSLWEANASAGGYISPQSLIFQAMPVAPLADADAVTGWLARLGQLPAYLDALGERYRRAAADGRTPTVVGVRQAIEQLTGHLSRPLPEDVLLTVNLPPGSEPARARAAEAIDAAVRPALRRLADVLTGELLPIARGDEQVGIGWVPGGPDGYRAAVRRHTTTDLSPEDIHQIGLDIIDELSGPWLELGRRTLAVTDLPTLLQRLREDPGLRFDSSQAILACVGDALARAEEARANWFPDLDVGPCTIEEIDPVEASNAALAYYRPPSADGTRPGAHCVLTTDPASRFSYEYEALAFHESVPGHHLQLASAQRLTGLPEYRRYLDAQLCAHIEGWGLYSERLADEMGLYSSDHARLGMYSFQALRACRLVVDTGMHALGWSRSRAARFMWDHTATTRANVDNEIDRYIAWPGQALSYQIGCREIVRLREQATAVLGPRFDTRQFHGLVLGQGPVPLPVLARVVGAWIDTERSAE